MVGWERVEESECMVLLATVTKVLLGVYKGVVWAEAKNGGFIYVVFFVVLGYLD